MKEPYYGTGGASFANDGSEFLGGPGNNSIFYHLCALLSLALFASAAAARAATVATCAATVAACAATVAACAAPVVAAPVVAAAAVFRR